jgi:hypothetical protein
MGPTEPSTKSFIVPKLDCDGSNWIIWKDQTLMVLNAGRGLKWHLEGTVRKPPLPLTFRVGHTLTKDELAEVEATEQKQDEYNQCKSYIKAQIFTTIEPGLQIEV